MSVRRLVLVAALLLCRCDGGDFDPFNLLVTTRPLALRATPPQGVPGQTVALDALVFVQPDKDEEPAYAWSWCPLASAPGDGYVCLVPRAQLELAAVLAGQDPAQLPSYDLGAGEQANFAVTQALVDTLAAACALLRTGVLPDGLATTLDCSAGLKPRIFLTLTADGVSSVATRTLELLPQADAVPHTNPAVDALLWRRQGSDQPFAAVQQGQMFALDTKFGLRIDFSPDISELFVASQDQTLPEQNEQIAFTWFIPCGTTDFGRTTFALDDSTLTFGKARDNVWRSSQFDSHCAPHGQLVVVARDLRGGVGWLVRDVRLQDASASDAANSSALKDTP